MNFLPEDDVTYLTEKGVRYELLTEKLAPQGTERRAILFPEFSFVGNLRALKDGQLAECHTSDLMIVIPQGYATTKLDSFYMSTHLKRTDGADPVNTAKDQELFGRKWQFWSRHLDDRDWRNGVDGIVTFLAYVRTALRTA
jgi:Prokaryotic E2 family E